MERKLKVRYLDGSSKYVGIKVQGKWFEKLGYKLGDEVTIKIEGKSLIIEKESSTPGGGSAF